jgi:hypothetical protein
MLYEKRNQPLLSRVEFAWRLGKNILIGFLLLVFSLLLGMAGYHWISGLGWVDSLLNASMILTGMGPVNQMSNNSAKIFASLYAIFSGVAFLTSVGVIFAPVLHRIMHKFHLEEDNE